MVTRSRFAALAVAAVFAADGRADDLMTLGGKSKDAAVTTLKGSAATDADTIEVFHRYGGCCWKKSFTCYAPVVSYGCCGGAGGYAAPAYSNGYGVTSSYAFAVTGAGIARYAPPAPAICNYYNFSQPAAAPYAYAHPVAPSASTNIAVATPRATFGLSVGNGGILLSRAGTGTGRQPSMAERAPETPSIEPQQPRSSPPTFRYDGGPAQPVPMPGVAPSLQWDEIPAINRVGIPAQKKLTYAAYGEKPAQPARASGLSFVVKNGKN